MEDYARYIAVADAIKEPAPIHFAIENYIELYHWLIDYINHKPDPVEEAAANTADVTLLAMFQLLDFLKEHIVKATESKLLEAPLQIKFPHLRILANIIRTESHQLSPLVIRILQVG